MIFRLECSCGYKSNFAAYASAGSLDFILPVYVPGDKTLHTMLIRRHQSESDRSFYDRIHSTKAEMVKDEYGADAVPMDTDAVMDEQFVICPVCGEKSAKFTFSGY